MWVRQPFPAIRGSVSLAFWTDPYIYHGASHLYHMVHMILDSGPVTTDIAFYGRHASREPTDGFPRMSYPNMHTHIMDVWTIMPGSAQRSSVGPHRAPRVTVPTMLYGSLFRTTDDFRTIRTTPPDGHDVGQHTYKVFDA